MTDVVKLVSITDYAEHWKISRNTVYTLIDSGRLTRYQTEDKNGNIIPLVNINQKPEDVQRYGNRSRYRTSSEADKTD